MISRSRRSCIISPQNSTNTIQKARSSTASLQARLDQRPQPGLRVPRPARLGGGDPAIEIGRDRLERGDEDRPLVGEVVVENALAQAGLARDLLHGERRSSRRGRDTSDGGAHDLGAPKRRHAASGAHAMHRPSFDWTTNYLRARDPSRQPERVFARASGTARAGELDERHRVAAERVLRQLASQRARYSALRSSTTGVSDARRPGAITASAGLMIASARPRSRRLRQPLPDGRRRRPGSGHGSWAGSLVALLPEPASTTARSRDADRASAPDRGEPPSSGPGAARWRSAAPLARRR